MKAGSIYTAALYMRLSKDDDGAAESASIITQRKMLRSYAAEHGYVVFDEYVDDGWSGTNFDRPDFKRMIGDIEAKKVNLVITKDLSRLGRDSLQQGNIRRSISPPRAYATSPSMTATIPTALIRTLPPSKTSSMRCMRGIHPRRSARLLPPRCGMALTLQPLRLTATRKIRWTKIIL